MPLERDDLRHLTAAQGYVELGMHCDAEAELEEIEPEVRHVPEVLQVRVDIYHALKKWDLLQPVAKKLALFDPQNSQWWISWAYATRRVDSIEAARLILVNALEAISNEAMIHFNLACYECLLGNVEEARSRLTKAITLDSELRLMALQEKDLEPLWDAV
jgi:tetratricopeptide (TPR) repeat protein